MASFISCSRQKNSNSHSFPGGFGHIACVWVRVTCAKSNVQFGNVFYASVTLQHGQISVFNCAGQTRSGLILSKLATRIFVQHKIHNLDHVIYSSVRSIEGVTTIEKIPTHHHFAWAEGPTWTLLLSTMGAHLAKPLCPAHIDMFRDPYLKLNGNWMWFVWWNVLLGNIPKQTDLYTTKY
jgi:hypothetical protein